MRKIKLCADIKHPPFEFINDEGDMEGFNIDITKTIAKLMDLDIDISLLDWEDAIEGFENGKYDVIQGMSLSGHREELYLFGANYLTTSHAMFALKKRDDIKDIIGFTNNKTYKIAAQKNDAGIFILNKRKTMGSENEILEVSNQEEGLDLLKREKVDLVVGNKLTLLYYAKKLAIEEDIKLIGNPLRLSKYGMAFKKEDREISDLFNEGMDRIVKSGEYEAVYTKWFGSGAEYFGKQIIENVELGVIYIDKLGRVTAINNFAKNLLSIRGDEAEFKSFYETKISEIFNIYIIQRILDGIEDSFNSQINIEISREVRYLEVNYSKLLDTANRVMGVLINFKDITEKTKLERMLSRRDKMESLGVLLLNMAHELRNPLTSIKNFIELMPRHIDDKEFREALLLHVPQQINYLNSLFTNLLEYSKPSEAKIDKINIKKLLESDLIKYISKFTDKNIEFKMDIEEDFFIEADANQIKQVFINLISNSIEAIEGSGFIDIYGCKEKNCIYIEDNGKGISKEEMGKIFDPFFTSRKDGTGLGLFITYNLMKENNGIIEFTSLEKGTRVSLIFEQESEERHG